MAVRVVRVADRHDAAIIPGGDRLYCRPQPRRDSAGLVKDDEDISSVDSLKSGFRVVRWLATHTNKAPANKPPISALHNTRQRSPVVESTDFLPQDGVNLIEGRGRGDNHGLVGRVDIHPPGRQSGGQEAFTDPVGRLDRCPLVSGQRLGYLALLRPQVNPGAFTSPGNRVIGETLAAGHFRRGLKSAYQGW